MTRRPLRGEPQKPPGLRQLAPIAVQVLGGLVIGLGVLVAAAIAAVPLLVGLHGAAGRVVEGAVIPTAACVCAALGWRARRRPAHAAGLYGFAALIAGLYVRELVRR